MDFKSTLQKFRADSKAAKSHNEEAVYAFHQTINNSQLEHRYSDSLPLLVVTDTNLSQRAQSRIRRQLSRKDSSQNLTQRNTFDSTTTVPNQTPLPLSSHSLNCIDTSAASASDADVAAAATLARFGDHT